MKQFELVNSLRLDNTIVSTICQDLTEGVSLRQVQKKYHISHSSAAKFRELVADELSAKASTRHAGIVSDYLNGMSGVQIRTKYVAGVRLIKKLVLASGNEYREQIASQYNRTAQAGTILSPEQHQLLVGSMLGDACMSERDILSNKKDHNEITSLRIIFSNSIKHISYLNHKRDLLAGLGKMKIGYITSGYGSRMARFSLCGKETLKPYRELFLRNKKKVVTEEWLRQLDWRGVAYWYMDDGHLVVNRNQPLVSFHTESFHAELSIIQEFLADYCGLQTRRVVNNKNPNNLFLTSRHKDEALRFQEMVSPHVIPCMKYKVRSVIP